MTDQEFNKQYDAAKIRGEFAQAVNKFVVDDLTALAALQELHERLQTFAGRHTCPQRLYYLTCDVRDLLNDADEYYKTDPLEGAEFEDDDEIRQLTETI
jgi:hypothetical protein